MWRRLVLLAAALLVSVIGLASSGAAAWSDMTICGCDGAVLNIVISSHDPLARASVWRQGAVPLGVRETERTGSIERLAAKAGGEAARASRFVTTPRGTTFDVPKGWVGRKADNGKGIVYQRPGATGNADSIRIMAPTAKYPKGYFRYYNERGQPLNAAGKPGSRADTHFPEDYQGRLSGWPR